MKQCRAVRGKDHVMDQQTNLARRLAPEEINKGMFVAVLSITHEFIPFFCESSSVFERGEPYRMAFLPDEEDARPLKVVAVCLPFVFVKDAHRHHRTLDVRRHRVAEIDWRFGKKYFNSVNRARKKSTASAKEC